VLVVAAILSHQRQCGRDIAPKNVGSQTTNSVGIWQTKSESFNKRKITGSEQNRSFAHIIKRGARRLESE
jgi:hypothetical protein